MDIRAYGKYFLIFVGLVLSQVMIFNNINVGSWGVTPLFYVLFVLVLPFEMPGWVLLISSFFMGYSIDVFCDTPGLNAGATVAMAFARPWILHLISPRDGYENGLHPFLMDMGIVWFFKYSMPLVFIHHLVYFIFDDFGFAHFVKTFAMVIVTSVITEFFVIISQYIFFRNNKG